MNLQKNIKKTLVRNTEKPVQKCTVLAIPENQTDPKETEKFWSNDVKNAEKNTNEVNCKPSKFDSPKLYSTLKLSKRIDEIVQPRKTKSCSDVGTKKLAADEKVTRKVNFPYSEPIYKDLIPLSSEHTHSQPYFPSRDPLPQKDKEPSLLAFIEPRNIPNYYSLPNLKIEKKSLSEASNNLRVYKLLELDN